MPKYSMKDGEVLKKIIIFLILVLILPITTNALEIDKDLESGIILSSDENIVSNDTVLSVKSASSNNIETQAKTFGFTKYNAYNISLLNKATRIVPTGEVTLSFPIPNSYNINMSKQIFILKLGNNSIDTVYATDQATIGLYEDLTIENGYALINTSSFSLDNDTTYVIGTTVTNNANNASNRTTTTHIDNPNTLDTNFSSLLVISIVAVGGIMLLITKLYLDNKN